jgi:hypothetical protein
MSVARKRRRWLVAVLIAGYVLVAGGGLLGCWLTKEHVERDMTAEMVTKTIEREHACEEAKKWQFEYGFKCGYNAGIMACRGRWDDLVLK